MGFYREATREEVRELKIYKRKFEKVRVSEFMAVDGKKYREVIFNKKYLEKVTGSITGSIFVDDNNDIVINKIILKKLCKISYMSEILFEDSSNLSIKRIVRKSGDVNREDRDKVFMNKALDIILKENAITNDMCDELKITVDEFYDSKNKDNEFIIKTINHAKDLVKANKNVITEDIIDAVLDDYINILLSNFIRVQKLSKHEKVLNEALTKCKAYEKKVKVKWISGRKLSFSKLNYNLYYYVKVINTYKQVINLSSSQYERKLEDIMKENINYRFDSIRTL